MSHLDRLLPAAGTALIMLPGALVGYSGTVRLPTQEPLRHMRYAALEAPAMSRLRVFPAVTSLSASEPVDLFTPADMAVLDAVDRAAAFDDLDYSGLFDYDDD